MKKLLPILLIILGVAGGVGAGMMMKPAPEPGAGAEAKDHDGTADAQPEPQHAQDTAAEPTEEGDVQPHSYVKVGRQTIVPVVEDGETKALMMFELAVDVEPSANDRALDMEPRLRDAFLRELLAMSYTGAFMTTFTDDKIIEQLRRNLVQAARRHLGKDVKDVLILDVMRQEK